MLRGVVMARRSRSRSCPTSPWRSPAAVESNSDCRVGSDDVRRPLAEGGNPTACASLHLQANESRSARCSRSPPGIASSVAAAGWLGQRPISAILRRGDARSRRPTRGGRRLLELPHRARRTPYAGGVPLETPFGTIYGTNITPDPETGIGRWSEAAFVRAMREGVDRDGSHLYPAFPYEHFTLAFRRRPARALRVRDDARPGADASAGEQAALSVQHPAVARRLERALPAPARLSVRSLREAPNGTAAPTSCNRSVTAAPATRRATRSAPRSADARARRRRGRRLVRAGPERRIAVAGALDRRALARYLRTASRASTRWPAGRCRKSSAGISRTRPPKTSTRWRSTRVDHGPATPDREARAAPAPRAGETPRVRDDRGSAARPNATRNAADAERVLRRCVRELPRPRARRASSGSALRLPLAVAVHDPDPRSLLRIIRDGIAPLPEASAVAGCRRSEVRSHRRAARRAPHLPASGSRPRRRPGATCRSQCANESTSS